MAILIGGKNDKTVNKSQRRPMDMKHPQRVIETTQIVKPPVQIRKKVIKSILNTNR